MFTSWLYTIIISTKCLVDFGSVFFSLHVATIHTPYAYIVFIYNYIIIINPAHALEG